MAKVWQYDPVTGQTAETATDAPVVQAVPSVPDSVTKRQLRAACMETPWGGSDLWTLAKAALAAGSADTREEWDLSIAIDRNNATFLAFATAMGATSDDIDNVFRLAETK